MDDTTRALPDGAELDEVMNRYAASIDLRDWARLRTVFVDGEIEADFTSMGVKQVFRLAGTHLPAPRCGWSTSAPRPTSVPGPATSTRSSISSAAGSAP